MTSPAPWGLVKVRLPQVLTGFACSLPPIGGVSVTAERLQEMRLLADDAHLRAKRNFGRLRASIGDVIQESAPSIERRAAIGTNSAEGVLQAKRYVRSHFGIREDLAAPSAWAVDFVASPGNQVHRFSRLQVSRTARRIASASFTCQRSAKDSRVFRSSLERSKCNCNSLGCIVCSHYVPKQSPCQGAKGEGNENFRGHLPRERGGRLTCLCSSRILMHTSHGKFLRIARMSSMRAIRFSCGSNRRTESLSPETPECPKRLTNNSRLVAGATTEKSRELRETLQPMSAMAIRSQAGEIRKVQRLSLRGVGSSDPKRETPRTGDEIAWSHAKA